MINYFLVVIAVCVIGYNAEVVPKQGSFNKYYIFTRNNSRVPIEMDATNVTATVGNLLDTRNTTVIVHGHGGSSTTSLNPDLKDAFLESEDINVIVVDWSVFTRQSYSIAVGAVPSVGAYLATLINELVDNAVVTLDTLHLVGFDLGAHVVGFTGRALEGKVARITGLSPARDQWGGNSRRLNSNDAAYVEIIHTDSGGIFGHGIDEAIGDVDFFVNGGSGQPGCFLNSYCSHSRSWALMAASLTLNHLIGNRCTSWLQVSLNRCRGISLRMGNNEFIKHGSGIFRVNTGSRHPF